MPGPYLPLLILLYPLPPLLLLPYFFSTRALLTFMTPPLYLRPTVFT